MPRVVRGLPSCWSDWWIARRLAAGWENDDVGGTCVAKNGGNGGTRIPLAEG